MWLSRTRFSPDGLGRRGDLMHEMDRFIDRESVLRTSEAREKRALGAAVSPDNSYILANKSKNHVIDRHCE